jgi:hypothetical protein
MPHTPMPAGRLTRRVAGVLVALVLVPASAVAVSITPWTPIFLGIDHATGQATIDAPAGERLQSVNALRIDLLRPGISFFTTPANPNGRSVGGSVPVSPETVSQTTSQFLTANELQVAVNANFYTPCCYGAGDDVAMDLRGLAISNGNLVSPPEETAFGAEMALLLIDEDNHARLADSEPGDYSGVFNAVAGAPLLLWEGENLGADDAGIHPRTAVGLSEDDRYLFLLTIDGRQPGFSDGATLSETAEWLARLGAYDGLNLDGGGSTTMVMSDGMGGALLLNSPIHDGVPGLERANGDQLGVFAAPLPIAAPEPSVFLVLMLGAVALIGWQLSNRQDEADSHVSPGRGRESDPHPASFIFCSSAWKRGWLLRSSENGTTAIAIRVGHRSS